MTFLKTACMLIDLDELGKTISCDTIEFEGRLWLVPEWNDMTLEGVTKPARLICLSVLPHRKAGPELEGVDYVLECPMTKAILSGQIQKEASFEVVVIENPDIEFPIA